MDNKISICITEFEKYLATENSDFAQKLASLLISKLSSYSTSEEVTERIEIDEVLLSFYLYKYIEVANTEVLKSLPYVPSLTSGRGNFIKSNILNEKIKNNVICIQPNVTYSDVKKYQKDVMGSIYKFKSKKNTEQFSSNEQKDAISRVSVTRNRFMHEFNEQFSIKENLADLLIVVFIITKSLSNLNRDEVE